MLTRIGVIKKDLHTITSVFLEDSSVKHRLKNVGMLSKQDAYDCGAVGPTARGSGVAIDLREMDMQPTANLTSNPLWQLKATVMHAAMSGYRELLRSIDIIEQAAKKIPEGPIDVKIIGVRNGEILLTG